jgi:HlyD family secretion protein
MTKRYVALVLLVVAAATIAAFVFLRPSEAQSDRQWATLVTKRGTLDDSIIAIGAIRPDVGGQVKVGSQISGIVEQLRVNAGDMVEKGDVLAVVNTTQMRARIDALEEDLATAKAEHAYAQMQLQRYSQVSEISRNQVDGFRRDAQVRGSSVRRAEAELRQARIELGYATITAPISGMIESVSTYQGETVAASFSAPTFVTIVDLQRLQIECNIDESSIGQVRAGQEVTFTVDAFASEVQKGVVRAILPKAEMVNSVVNYIVIVDILDKKALSLRPQMTARVNFVLRAKDGIILVPRSAVIRDGGSSYILVRDAGSWKKTKVRTGSGNSQQVEISSGVDSGETVLVDGQLWVTEHGGGADD